VDGERLGWIRENHLPVLLAFGEVLEEDGDGVALRASLADPASRTEAVAGVVRELDRRGVFSEHCEERYPVLRHWGEPPRFVLPRCAVSFFGVRSYGVHLNATVEGPDGLRVWVARRTDKVRTEPLKLDHLAAGGQPFGLGLRENLRKEAWEEAGIPASLVAGAKPAGFVSYRQEVEEGIRDEVIHVFDLALPPDFVPEGRDGELEGFELWSVARLQRTLAETGDFKLNVALVNLDLLVRRGLLDPETEEDYEAILLGLRR